MPLHHFEKPLLATLSPCLLAHRPLFLFKTRYFFASLSHEEEVMPQLNALARPEAVSLRIHSSLREGRCPT
jgi:hypothetical protein